MRRTPTEPGSVEVAGGLMTGWFTSWLYREEPDNERDSGWRVFAGDEPAGYVGDVDNCSVLPLRELIGADPSVEAVLTEPAPDRGSRDDDFVPVG